MSKTSGGCSIGLGTLLVVIFVVLKLTDNIDWSWWWVFSPWWIQIVLVIAFYIVGAIIEAISSMGR